MSATASPPVTGDLLIVEPAPSSPRWFVPPVIGPPPERFRRPPGRLRLDPETTPNNRWKHSETVTFRFRTRLITAAAAIHSNIHPNVTLLHVLPSITERVVRTIVRLLPSPLRARFEKSFPEWNLPLRLVLKRYKEGWDQEFDTEKATYQKVKPLQGTVIPVCYGELKYKGTRALLLSDIGGENLATPQGALLEVMDFRRMLHDAYSALAQFGVMQDDVKLDNFHVIGDKIMIVDLERVTADVSAEKCPFHIKNDVNRLAQYYEDNQYCFWIDGLILVDT
ncbi:hypothetical protein HIM_02464 [Hirsutella minnesotensis 3608]|nr:hypothetical protein HIM_02464 [Hirsutella minnesotensis 3608]